MLSSRHTTLIALLLFAAVSGRSQTVLTWANTGTDLTQAANWGGTAPSASTVIQFLDAGSLLQPSIGTNTSVAGVTFSTTANNYTVGGTGTLIVGASGITNLNADSTKMQVISAPVQLTGAAANILNAGALQLGTIANNTTGSLVLDGDGSMGVVAGSITGGTGLVKTGAGTWSLNAANSYGGSTTVNDGTLNVGAGGSLPAGTDVTISATTADTVTLNIAASTQSIGKLGFGGVSGSMANLTIASGSTVSLGGTVTYDATSNPDGASISGGALSLGGNRVFDIGHSAANSEVPDLNIDSAISGSGSLTKTGSGRLVLAGNNAYTGDTIVHDGRLQLAAGGTFPSGGNVVVDATSAGGTAAFDLGGTAQTVGSLTLRGAGNSTNIVDLGPNGNLTLSGNVRYDATNSPAGGTIFNGTLDLGSTNHTVTVDDSANADVDLTIGSDIIGTGGLTKTGAGVLLLQGNNSYTGTTTISTGTLQVGDADRGSGIAGDIVNNAALVFGQSPVTYNGVISGTGTVEVNDLLTLTGNSTYTGTTTINSGGTLQLGLGETEAGGLSGGVVSPSIVNHGTIMVYRSNAVSLGGISGEGELEKHGSGTLTLTGGNSYQGHTFIYGGTVTDQNDAAFSSNSSVYMFSGVLNVAGNETIGALGDWTFGDAIPPAAPAVTVAASKTLKVTGGSDFSGGISGAGNLEIGDGAYQVLFGNVTLAGTTTVDFGGTLQIGDSSGDSGSVSGAVLNNGTLSFHRAGNVSVGTISGSGILNQNGTGTLTLAGSNSYSGDTIVNAGVLTDDSAMAFSPNSRLRLNQSGASVNVAHDETIRGLDGGFGSVGTTTNVASGATLTINQAGSSYLGIIGGNGSVALSGTGSQVLGGANTYSGGTTINGGLLIATNTSGSATGTGAITVANGATLQLGANGSGGMVSGNVANNGNINFTSTDSTAIYAGVISGSGSLSINSTGGTLTLAGANIYTGPTLLNTGTLRIGAVNALPVGSSLSLGSSGNLDVAANQRVSAPLGGSSSGHITVESGATLTLAPTTPMPVLGVKPVISGAGGLAVAGDPGTTVNLTGTNTYSGGTNVTSGTLLAGSQSLGSGAVVVAGGATLGGLSSATSSTTLTNAITLSDGANLLGGGDKNPLLLGGTVTVPASSGTMNVSGTVAFTGTLKANSGPTALTIASSGTDAGRAIVLGPADASITSITATSEAVIFGSQFSLPGSGLTLGANNGYLGIGSMSGYTTPTLSSLLTLVTNKPAFSGTIGFDTLASSAAPNVFNDGIDLSAFGSGTTLGSTTSAVLRGAITTAGGVGYQFGNGGGVLAVQSNLTGANALSVNSLAGLNQNDLTVVLQGSNTFTGGASITNSSLVLDSATALPGGQQVSLGDKGYIGFTEAFAGETSLRDFIAHRIADYTASSIIGLDSHAYLAAGLSTGSPSGRRYDSETIDLSGLGAVYLGTRSDLYLEGTILAPAQNGAGKVLRLMPVNDSRLTIASALVPDNVSAVVIGSTSSARSTGSVSLEARNTYSGGTTLLSGTLAIKQDSLGTGALVVDANSQKPVLAANDDVVFVGNNVSLEGRLSLGQVDHGASKGFSFGELIMDGTIGGSGGLDIFDETSLYGENPFTGGVNLYSGRLWIGNDNALGTGALTISTGPNNAEIGIYNGAHTISNSIVFNGAYDQLLTLYTNTGLTIGGALQVNSNMYLSVYGDPVRLNGPVIGSGKLTIYNGTVYMNPASRTTNAAGFEATAGSLILQNGDALPTGTGQVLTSDAAGYIGISYLPENLQSDFINRFTPSNTVGTIGFDSPSLVEPNTFSGSIDLSRFASSPTLGSASTAILTGAITPKGNTYSFGGGGGFLQVNSALTDAPAPRALYVVSYGYSGSNSLTLRLTGANSYTGATTVYNSGLIFGSGALPASASAANITGSTGAYIGTEDLTFVSNPAGFISRINPYSFNTAIGFDSFAGTVTVSQPISLAGFNVLGNDQQIALGTATSAVISGAITLPDVQPAYRFIGYKGGQLTVSSTLSDGAVARSVVIGDDTVTATFGSSSDADGVLSSVTLTGANTYTGGTRLKAGQLYVGSSTALGSGALTVSDESFGDRHLGLYSSGAQTINNALIMSGDAALDIGGNSDFTLTGAISGAGELFKTGGGRLTLSGDNRSYGGEIYVQGGELVFDHANSVGGGALSFGFSGGIATFNESSTVNGISGDHPEDTIHLADGITLTVNQDDDAEYPGIFTGNNVALKFKGAEDPKLTLSGASSFTGTVTIQSGAKIVVANPAAFGQASNSVTLNGGKLAVGSGTTMSNPLTLSAGKLGGSGTFEAPAGGSGFNIGTGIVLHPGAGSGIGETHFDGHLISTSVLLLSGGGAYQWGLLDAVANGAWDSVVVAGTVDITATNASPFTFQLNTIDSSGNAAYALNFDPTKPYSWTVLSADSIANFSSAKFNLDTSSFFNSANGIFSLSTNGSNTALMLNFTPVPEPSTYALIIAGLGVTLFASRRRRRR